MVVHFQLVFFQRFEQGSFSRVNGKLRPAVNDDFKGFSHGLEVKVPKIRGINFTVYLADQVRRNFRFLRSHLYIVWN